MALADHVHVWRERSLTMASQWHSISRVNGWRVLARAPPVPGEPRDGREGFPSPASRPHPTASGAGPLPALLRPTTPVRPALSSADTGAVHLDAGAPRLRAALY